MGESWSLPVGRFQTPRNVIPSACYLSVQSLASGDRIQEGPGTWDLRFHEDAHFQPWLGPTAHESHCGLAAGLRAPTERSLGVPRVVNPGTPGLTRASPLRPELHESLAANSHSAQCGRGTRHSSRESLTPWGLSPCVSPSSPLPSIPSSAWWGRKQHPACVPAYHLQPQPLA